MAPLVRESESEMREVRILKGCLIVQDTCSPLLFPRPCVVIITITIIIIIDIIIIDIIAIIAIIIIVIIIIIIVQDTCCPLSFPRPSGLTEEARL